MEIKKRNLNGNLNIGFLRKMLNRVVRKIQIWGNFGGTFNLGYYDGGTSRPGLAEPIGANNRAPPLDVE